MKRNIPLICATIICAFGMLAAQTKKAATPPPKPAAHQDGSIDGSPKIITATKTVGVFWDMEISLAEAFAKKDSASLDKMLPEEFKVVRPNVTGSSIGREDWLAEGKDNPKPTRITQMSVESYPDLAIVQFIGAGPATSGSKAGSKQYFVVDTWENHDGNWQLVTRYVAEIAPIKMPARPTGKQ